MRAVVVVLCLVLVCPSVGISVGNWLPVADEVFIESQLYFDGEYKNSDEPLHFWQTEVGWIWTEATLTEEPHFLTGTPYLACSTSVNFYNIFAWQGQYAMNQAYQHTFAGKVNGMGFAT